MLNDRYKKWYESLDYSEKHAAIKDKAIELNKNHKKVNKASDTEFCFNGCRTGIRGGRMTTLQANTARASKAYNDSRYELEYMVTHL